MRRDQRLATDQYVSVAVVAKRYGIHRSTLWRLIRLGSIPAYRVGRRALRVRLSDVEQYVRSRKLRPALKATEVFKALSCSCSEPTAVHIAPTERSTQ